MEIKKKIVENKMKEKERKWDGFELLDPEYSLWERKKEREDGDLLWDGECKSASLSLFFFIFFSLPWFGGGFNLGSKDNGERGKKKKYAPG